MATLLKPLVVNGVVVAEPGQTIGGHVAEIQKAGHISGLARLGVQLTDLTLVDGQQIPIKSSLVSRTGPSSVGQDAGAIAGTTALGAAVGAAAAWGKGAAIGAGSGAALGIIGVLVTRGHPSILYPEQTLTFRIEAPVTIATDHAPQAFHYVEPGEYSQPMYSQGPGPVGQYGPYTAAPYPAYPPVAAVALLLRLLLIRIMHMATPLLGSRVLPIFGRTLLRRVSWRLLRWTLRGRRLWRAGDRWRRGARRCGRSQ